VAGGVRIDEPGADLAVALAIASAARGAPVRGGVACLGEIGLTGRLRPVPQLERRLAECSKLGLAEAIVPEDTSRHGRMTLRAVPTLRRAIAAGLDASRPSEG
jgi:DNA repair protein RadA/Sms